MWTKNYQTKQSLVYDLQEPFRWLSDVSVIEAFESEALKLSDFYFTGDDYRYRFEPDARQRFIDLIRERFNSGVVQGGRVLKWDTIIEQKSNELGRFLAHKSALIGIGGRILEIMLPSKFITNTGTLFLDNQ